MLLRNRKSGVLCSNCCPHDPFPDKRLMINGLNDDSLSARQNESGLSLLRTVNPLATIHHKICNLCSSHKFSVVIVVSSYSPKILRPIGNSKLPLSVIVRVKMQKPVEGVFPVCSFILTCYVSGKSCLLV